MNRMILIGTLILAFHSLSARADFAGCGATSYVVAEGSPHIGIVGRTYSPKCLRVKVGTTVQIDASARHPLQGTAEAANPIFDELGGAVMSKSVTFNSPGEFGYYCQAHGDDTGIGMAGAILVE